jgi:hypothetical protein
MFAASPAELVTPSRRDKDSQLALAATQPAAILAAD